MVVLISTRIKSKMSNPTVKRVYEAADGFRILVDRIWPRGLSKDQARVDLWLKQIAPSTELRQWFAHDPARWDEFRRRYFEELDRNAEAVATLRERIAEGPVTLLYATKQARFNNAVSLVEYLKRISDTA